MAPSYSMKPFKLSLLLVLLLITLGCSKHAPMYAPGPNAVDNSRLTVETMGKAIADAGAMLGWEVRPESPGTMKAIKTQRNGKHVVVLRIVYTATTYSISYAESINMNYDGRNIHPKYNKWVTELERNIRVKALSV